MQLDFCTQDGDEWDVSAKVDNPNEIGHTLIGIIKKILLKDPVIDNILQNAK
ncbi:hypothetical protein HAINFHK1212_1659 [Haemophilus influenzae HK1212]|uniref:Uncharacterized protein n=1 Tax=Haemophilus influenzae HK1212 TaxID=456482 RepID=A0A7G2K1G9_HAEIF|nr:hypothetical protein HAINFHK1212_1659 [Haemophilus influenzae HK1212]